MYEIKTLSNNLKIAYERIPYARSVSAGVWVLSGSRYEKISGMSHFIEHMLFKGTKTKTAKQIAECMDLTGGQLNAYTTREYTCFYSMTVASHMNDALELLSDMIKNSRFSPEDIELEKNVVLEEIAMYEDSPEDLVFDLLEEHTWSKSPLGRNITGTRESVISITRDDILEHMQGCYVPSNMVLSVAGAFDTDELFEAAEKYFGDMPNVCARILKTEKPVFYSGAHTEIKNIEQTNIAIGYESFGYDTEARFPLIVMNNVFGGGMSSRLFQAIREESGLAYSVYTSVSSYRDIGLYSIYAGLKPENLEKTMEIIKKETARLAEAGLSDEEIMRGKEQVCGSIILSGEGVGSHMSMIGKGTLLGNRVYEEDELIALIRSVTSEDIKNIARKIFGDEKNFTETVKGK